MLYGRCGRGNMVKTRKSGKEEKKEDGKKNVTKMKEWESAEKIREGADDKENVKIREGNGKESR